MSQLIPNSAKDASRPDLPSRAISIGNVVLFTQRLNWLWAIVGLLTVVPELLPIGPMHLALFSLYYALKVISFYLLGFVAPLAFQSLDGIGRGMLLSFLSALLIESFQGLLHNGHVFHWYELIGKLTLILLGFGCALNFRYERQIPFGPVKLKLITDIY